MSRLTNILAKLRAHEVELRERGVVHVAAVTSMSPLQFQKEVRLQTARQMLLSSDLDAAKVGYRVGYRDESQFNREYKRLFGEPPVRDKHRLGAIGAKQGAVAMAGAR